MPVPIPATRPTKKVVVLIHVHRVPSVITESSCCDDSCRWFHQVGILVRFHLASALWVHGNCCSGPPVNRFGYSRSGEKQGHSDDSHSWDTCDLPNCAKPVRL